MVEDVRQRAATLRRAADRSSAPSSGRAIGFLVLAAVAAVGCAVLVMQYLDQRAAAKPQGVGLYVAAVDLQMGMTLATDVVEVRVFPTGARPAGSFQSFADIDARVVTSRIFAGEPITERRISPPGAGSGLAAILPEGQRAVAVRVDDVVGVAGFVHPGDRVDVIVTMQPTKGGDFVSKFILDSIQVLAVGKQIDPVEGSKARHAVAATVATLMVSPEQAEKLALAAAKGEILLALRSSLDDEMLETAGVAPSVLMYGVAKPPPRVRGPARAVAPAPAPVPTPLEVPDTVEILRGDQREERVFGGRP